MKQLLFVYGSLKRGFSRHEVLSNQRYLGTAATVPKYSMYQYSSFPALVESESGCSVIGELYEVNIECLTETDIIEGCREGVFERKAVELEEITLLALPMNQNTWSDIEKKTAQCYFFKKNPAGAANCGRFWGQK